MNEKTNISSKLELRFFEWLEHNDYPYLYIDQTIQTFSTLFKNIAKRPDFLIVLPSIGIIAVDVKYAKYYKKFDSFVLDEQEEIIKLSTFEFIFQIPVWISFANVRIDFGTMFWISLNEVRNIQKRFNRKTKNAFRAIPVKDCITIGWEDGLGKLIKPYKQNNNYNI